LPDLGICHHGSRDYGSPKPGFASACFLIEGFRGVQEIYAAPMDKNLTR
jgi:hypothetical protein